MVEYGQNNTVSKKAKRTPPLVLFGISFGEISYLDFEPNTKLKVQQEDLLIFFRQMSVMLKSGVPLSQGIELLAENVNNKKFGANLLDVSKRLGGGEELRGGRDALRGRAVPTRFARALRRVARGFAKRGERRAIGGRGLRRSRVPKRALRGTWRHRGLRRGGTRRRAEQRRE